MVKAFLSLNEVDDVKRYGTAKGDLNTTYLLVIEHPQSGMPTADWVLAHYNFARAQAILFVLARAGHETQRGPYLVSSLKSLSNLPAPPEPHLWQDMSGVPPSVAASWEKVFEKRAARNEFWAPDTRNQALLNLRGLIAESADAMITVNGSAVDFKKMLAEWVSWK